MKLGLLVVLAVAVLVPSLSEGQNVPSCQLKEPNQTAVEAGNMRNKREADESEESDSTQADSSVEEIRRHVKRALSTLKPRQKRLFGFLIPLLPHLIGAIPQVIGALRG
uniref:Antibacterial toxin n=1 Tax=Pogonoperca punctata TaxID=160738 RepID=A0ZT18_POGPU|nr:antibacterial toxin [Pogonoperca punctata]